MKVQRKFLNILFICFLFSFFEIKAFEISLKTNYSYVSRSFDLKEGKYSYYSCRRYLILCDDDFYIKVYNNGEVEGKFKVRKTTEEYGYILKLYFTFFEDESKEYALCDAFVLKCYDFLPQRVGDIFDFKTNIGSEYTKEVKNFSIKLESDAYHKNKFINAMYKNPERIIATTTLSVLLSLIGGALWALEEEGLIDISSFLGIFNKWGGILHP